MRSIFSSDLTKDAKVQDYAKTKKRMKYIKRGRKGEVDQRREVEIKNIVSHRTGTAI